MSGDADDRLVAALRAALDARTRHRATELLDAATTEAEQRVQQLLRDELVASMLRQVAADLDGTPAASGEGAGEPAPPAAEPAGAGAVTPDAVTPAGTGTRTGWYAFGIMSADPQPDTLPDGVEVVGHGPHGLRALVMEVPLEDFPAEGDQIDPNDLTWLEYYARLHDEVLNRALDSGPVLPLRFGTIVGDHDRVRELLARHGTSCADWLTALADRAEFAVKAWVDHARIADRVAPPDREPASGADYLRARQAARTRDEEVRDRVAALVEEVHRRLAEVADDAAVVSVRADSPPPQPDHHGAYLLSPTRRETLSELVATLVAEHEPDGLQLALTGPWPAHHFLPTEWEEAATS